MARSSLALVAALTIGSVPATAQSFMPLHEATRAVADGKPWSVTTSEGRQAKMTLNSDGSGKFEGPITMTITWQINGEEMCLNLKMAGTKCLRFRAIKGGYQGFQGQAVDLTFVR